MRAFVSYHELIPTVIQIQSYLIVAVLVLTFTGVFSATYKLVNWLCDRYIAKCFLELPPVVQREGRR